MYNHMHACRKRNTGQSAKTDKITFVILIQASIIPEVVELRLHHGTPSEQRTLYLPEQQKNTNAVINMFIVEKLEITLIL